MIWHYCLVIVPYISSNHSDSIDFLDSLTIHLYHSLLVLLMISIVCTELVYKYNEDLRISIIYNLIFRRQNSFLPITHSFMHFHDHLARSLMTSKKGQINIKYNNQHVNSVNNKNSPWKFWLLSLSHHHHVVPQAWISLTLSRHFSLSFIASGRSSGLHPVSSHSCCMFELVALLLHSLMWGVHRSTSLMSSSLLLQQ